MCHRRAGSRPTPLPVRPRTTPRAVSVASEFPYSLLVLRFGLARQHLAHGFAVQFDAMGIVEQAVEDAVGDGGVADLLVPVGHWHLRSENQGAALIAIIADLEKVATFTVL